VDVAADLDGLAFLRGFYQSGDGMKQGTARLWKEAGRWVIRIELDGAFYCEREYADAPTATHAIASILRQRAERSDDLDQEACEDCEEPLDLMVCSQCGADGFVRTCGHGGPPPIRVTEGAVYCRSCRASGDAA
jgi:hypothetical protein